MSGAARNGHAGADGERSSTGSSSDTSCCDAIFATPCCLALEGIGNKIVIVVEKVFYEWVNGFSYRQYNQHFFKQFCCVVICCSLGVKVGKYPVAFMIGSLLLAGAMLPGLLIPGLFVEETDPLNLWTPLGIPARCVTRFQSYDTLHSSIIILRSNVNILRCYQRRQGLGWRKLPEQVSYWNHDCNVRQHLDARRNTSCNYRIWYWTDCHVHDCSQCCSL